MGPYRRDRRPVRVCDPLLGGLRTGGLDAGPDGRPEYAARSVWLWLPILVAPEPAANLRHPPRADLRGRVDPPGPSRAIGAGEIRARPDVHGAGVRHHAAR